MQQQDNEVFDRFLFAKGRSSKQTIVAFGCKDNKLNDIALPVRLFANQQQLNFITN
jgi:hypothetical protein